jgi:hypothetical protein
MGQFNLQNYEEVKDRIPRFYAKYPDGRLITKLENHTDEFGKVVFKAEAWNGEILLSTGWAYEEKTTTGNGVNRDAWVENCETSAIGRALANLGLNGEKPRPSREEMQKVQKAQPSQDKPHEAPGLETGLLTRRKALYDTGDATIQGLLAKSKTTWSTSDLATKTLAVEQIEKQWETIKSTTKKPIENEDLIAKVFEGEVVDDPGLGIF